MPGIIPRHPARYVSAGTYTITVSATGYQTQTQLATVTVGNTTAVNMWLWPAASSTNGNLGGTVKNPNGAAIAGATVQIAGPISGTVLSNAQGIWNAGLMPGGTYTVAVSASGYKPQTLSATVTGGNATAINTWLWP
jgi:large repetitive protein